MAAESTTGAGLQDFIEHVAKIQAEEDAANGGFTSEFQRLREMTAEYKGKVPRACGSQPSTVKKNRYKDITPYDDCRVVLPAETDEEGEVITGSDYINASIVDHVESGCRYIASQGPLPHTVDDFWRMIWHNDVRVVIMACNIFEQDRLKCAKYWAEPGEKEVFGDFGVETLSTESKDADFLLRKLKLSLGESSRVVYQYHYTSWPDHGVPERPGSVMRLLANVRELQPVNKDSPPVCIHCSAGVGRTGTLCAIDIMWTLLKLQGLAAPCFDVFGTTWFLRQRRPAMVQTLDQYIFVHKAILDLVEQVLHSNDEPIEPTSETAPVQDTTPGPVIRAEPAYVNIVEMRKYTSKVPAEDMRRFSMLQMPAVHGFTAAPKQDDDFECNRIEASENKPVAQASLALQRPKQKPVGSRPMPTSWGPPRKSSKTH